MTAGNRSYYTAGDRVTVTPDYPLGGAGAGYPWMVGWPGTICEGNAYEGGSVRIKFDRRPTDKAINLDWDYNKDPIWQKRSFDYCTLEGWYIAVYYVKPLPTVPTTHEVW